MSDTDQDNKARNRKIAQNEAERQTIGDRIAWVFNIIFHFFDHTRWSRMFHVVH